MRGALTSIHQLAINIGMFTALLSDADRAGARCGDCS